jgi:hypothetical protein
VIGPDLKIHRSFNLMIPGIGVPLGARAMDRQGRYYLQIPGWLNGPRGGTDTIVVIRFDSRTQRVDTLARIKGSTPRKNTMKPGIPYVLFAPQDVWNVTSEGRLGVVRSGDYHVEWREADGRVNSGPRIPFERRQVTMEDRMAHPPFHGDQHRWEDADGLDRFRGMLEDTVVTSPSAGSRGRARAIPDVTPLIGPDGSLWVDDPSQVPQTWDIGGANGAIAGRCVPGAKARLVRPALALCDRDR